MIATLKFSIQQSAEGYQIIFETPGQAVSKSRVFPTIGEALKTLGEALEGLERIEGLTIKGISNSAGERLSA